LSYETALFWEIEKAFDTTWHFGFLYKLSNIKFVVSVIRLISVFFLREISETRSKMKYLRQSIQKQGYHKVSSCPPHCTVYIQPGAYVGLFADDIYVYATGLVGR
jgi:hypothetical protein